MLCCVACRIIRLENVSILIHAYYSIVFGSAACAAVVVVTTVIIVDVVAGMLILLGGVTIVVVMFFVERVFDAAREYGLSSLSRINCCIAVLKASDPTAVACRFTAVDRHMGPVLALARLPLGRRNSRLVLGTAAVVGHCLS